MADLKPWRATFETMILPNGIGKEPVGPFTVEVFDARRLGSMKPYWKSCLIPTRQKYGEGRSSAKRVKEDVEAGFRKKIKDWEQV